MSGTRPTLADRYDRAASQWGDKMRVLGYYDAYLGFLSAPGLRCGPGKRVIDVGCGTGSFACAHVAVNGMPARLDLLDPSVQMLDAAAAGLARHGVDAVRTQGVLGDDVPKADEVLAAHVLEHCADPVTGLKQLRKLVASEGRLRIVLSKPHWCNALIWLQWRHRTFGEAEISKIFQEAGLRIEQTYAFPSGPPSRTSRGIVASRA